MSCIWRRPIGGGVMEVSPGAGAGARSSGGRKGRRGRGRVESSGCRRARLEVVRLGGLIGRWCGGGRDGGCVHGRVGRRASI